MRYFEEPEYGELLCSMIYTFAKVCGIPHYPHWDNQTEVDRERYSDAIRELCSAVYDHRSQFEDEADVTPFEASIWYRENWRIFPWSEPEYYNLPELNQEFVCSVAEFGLSMSGHFGTQLAPEEEVNE
jgi:hypothetical protein